MLAEIEMAEKLFLMLNGIGVVFLIWVLIEFMKEGLRSRAAGRASVQCIPMHGDRTDFVGAAFPEEYEAASLRDRKVIHFRAPQDSPSESKLVAKSAELNRSTPSKGYGTR